MYVILVLAVVLIPTSLVLVAKCLERRFREKKVTTHSFKNPITLNEANPDANKQKTVDIDLYKMTVDHKFPQIPSKHKIDQKTDLNVVFEGNTVTPDTSGLDMNIDETLR